MRIPKRRSELFKTYDTGPVHVTKETLERMKRRLAELKQSLPELAHEAERTASYGDRSENAEYKDAKATLRRTHRQIYSIEDQLKRIVVIEPGTTQHGSIRIGSVVELESTAGISTFQILGSKETDPTRGRISFNSPLGAALMNKKKGDSVNITTERGVRTYTIREIR
jgi:transcription elongation GreA/GreB family factor